MRIWRLDSTALTVLLIAILPIGPAQALSDQRDTTVFFTALNDLMRSAVIGKTIEWHNPTTGNRGTVSSVKQTGLKCWEFERTYPDKGRTMMVEGLACEVVPGLWEIKKEETPKPAHGSLWANREAALNVARSGPQATESQVREAQTLLTEIGYDAGPADGAVGPRTKAALERFQRAYGIPATGQVNVDTLHLLRDASKRAKKHAAEVCQKPNRFCKSIRMIDFDILAWGRTDFRLAAAAGGSGWCAKEANGYLFTRSFEPRFGPSFAIALEDAFNAHLKSRCPALQAITIYAENGKVFGDDPDNTRMFGHARRSSRGWTVSTVKGGDPGPYANAPRGNTSILDVITASKGGVGAAVRATERYADEAEAEEAEAKRQRQQVYASKGLYCEAKETVIFCSVTSTTEYGLVPAGKNRVGMLPHTTTGSDCTGRCYGANGWCDSATGQLFGSIAAAEQANCRKATKAEINDMLGRADRTQHRPPKYSVTFDEEIRN